jgi:hypothetical protein
MLLSKAILIPSLCSLCSAAAFVHRPISQPFAIGKLGSLSDFLHASTDLDPNRSQLQERSGGWGDERIVPPLAPGQPPHIRKAHERLARIEEAHRAKVQKEAPRRGRPWFENNSVNRRGLQIVIPGRRNRTTYKWLVLSTHKLGKVMNSYCRTISITRNCIRFFYNDREVRDDDTPDSVSELPVNLHSWGCFRQGFHSVRSRYMGLILPLS